MANFSINELKYNLGTELGLRKNRYMIEIPIPTISGDKLNLLCRSAGFPERNITTTEMWHKGRRYAVRGETDYGTDYEITVMDNSMMEIRQMFDAWMKLVDDSKVSFDSGYASYETLGDRIGDSLNEISNSVSQLSNTVNSVQKTFKSATSSITGAIDFFLGGGFNLSNQNINEKDYQIDINIWQMNRKHNKVYGYKLQNAFPKSIGAITFDDSEQDTLSEFNVTFAFSEFVPIKNNNLENLTNQFNSIVDEFQTIL